MNLFGGFKLHYLPKIGCIWFLSTFILCYIIAVANNHVEPFIPFVSDCGTLPPESCIFGQMLNIGAVITAISMYVRYRQVDIVIDSKVVDLSRKWNEVAFWTGNTVCIGISIVANFQPTSLLSMHMIGGTMAFGTAVIYFFIQTRISASFTTIHLKYYPKYGVSKSMLYLRIFLSSLYLILYIGTLFFLIKALREFKGADVLSWKEEDGGMEYRKVSAVLEWLTVFVFIIMASTGEKEFKSIEFEEIRFKSKLPPVTNNKAKLM